MKKLFALIIGLATVALTSAQIVKADEENYYNQLDRQSTGSDLQVKVWVDKGKDANYRPGDDIRVYFRTNRDAYVFIYNIDTRGYVHLLYPYEYRDSRFVQGNRAYRVPDQRDDYQLKVNGPEGTERIVAVATLDPFYLPDLGWNVDFDDLREEDYAYMRQLEGEDEWDFIERLNHRLVPDNVNYELDAVALKVESPYPKSYYVEPSFYFSYHRYPSWYSANLYFGGVYFDYPYRAAIYIDGIFFGYAPLSLPYFLYGRHYVTAYYGGYCVYRDYVHVRQKQHVRVAIPPNRIYKNYAQRYSKDYVVVKNKPEVFWTKVREMNTKYRSTPVIKDDFRFRKNDRDLSRDLTGKTRELPTGVRASKEARLRETLQLPKQGASRVAQDKQGREVSKSGLPNRLEERLKSQGERIELKGSPESGRSQEKGKTFDQSQGKRIESPESRFRKEESVTSPGPKETLVERVKGPELPGGPQSRGESPESRFRREEPATPSSGKVSPTERLRGPELPTAPSRNESPESRFRKEVPAVTPSVGRSPEERLKGPELPRAPTRKESPEERFRDSGSRFTSPANRDESSEPAGRRIEAPTPQSRPEKVERVQPETRVKDSGGERERQGQGVRETPRTQDKSSGKVERGANPRGKK